MRCKLEFVFTCNGLQCVPRIKSIMADKHSIYVIILNLSNLPFRKQKVLIVWVFFPAAFP